MQNIFVSDAEVASAITMQEAIEVMRAAFVDLGRDQSFVQDRMRLHGTGASLSMMGGIYGAAQVMGTKVYSTVQGQFDFVIPLFSSATGKLLRIVQGNQLTRLRTAAVTRIVADAVVPAGPLRLAIFGSGVQARAHAEAFCERGRVSQVLVCAIDGADAFSADIGRLYGIASDTADAERAVRDADIVITATRATAPLFDGALLKPGAFVAAIGSSKPQAREVDDQVLARASMVIVESAGQALREAGEFVMASRPEALVAKLVELGPLLAGEVSARAQGGGDIVLYKSVGIGLEDVALAHRIHQRLPMSAPQAESEALPSGLESAASRL
ncbi:ornithine cyclodeaminase family protein [Variovorax paradoxus]|uniref:Ornithine cyclodeaminase/mu-crystallin n=1 Tax=Variovorax paradoxus (strain EPS) TaxID=595537 RepID=E6V248_VARPE|nr:ornithine cyclodeaminase family protein [Variovorax paradoxus]ADU39127.1 ornithine cyclodeaminase/mu-crystallin [Variovorax paradoxus EPS]